jgi:hypothetical protein
VNILGERPHGEYLSVNGLGKKESTTPPPPPEETAFPEEVQK